MESVGGDAGLPVGLVLKSTSFYAEAGGQVIPHDSKEKTDKMDHFRLAILVICSGKTAVQKLSTAKWLPVMYCTFAMPYLLDQKHSGNYLLLLYVTHVCRF